MLSYSKLLSLAEKERGQSSEFSLSTEYYKQQRYFTVKVIQNTDNILGIFLRKWDIYCHSHGLKWKALKRVRFSGSILGNITKNCLYIPLTCEQANINDKYKRCGIENLDNKKKSIQINFKSDFSFSTYSLIQCNPGFHCHFTEIILSKIIHVLFTNRFFFLISGCLITQTMPSFSKHSFLLAIIMYIS